MARRPISTNSFNAVAANQTATLDLPVGDLTYHGVVLYYDTATSGGPSQANVESEISRVRVKVNGKTQVELTGAQLVAINTLYGRPFMFSADGAWLPIYFSPLGRKSRSAQGEDALAWGTADVATLQIEVDIGGATSPTLAARVLVDDIRRPMGPIVKFRPFVVPVSATGITTVTTFPRNDDYYALHCFSSVLDDVEVKVDQRELFKLTAAQIDYLLADHDFIVPISGLVPVIFNFSQRVADSLRMRRGDGRPSSEFRVDFNMNTATSFTVVAETVGLRD